MSFYQKPFRGMQINRSHSLAKGLVGCWVMNEGTGNKVFDLSGNSNHGTLINNADWVITEYDMGIECPTDNSSDRINLGSINSANPLSGVPTGEISIVSKVYKPADTDLNNLYPRVFDKSSAGSFVNGWGIFYQNTSSYGFFSMFNSTNGPYSGYKPDKGWYDVAATIKNGDQKLYVNGDVYSTAITMSFSSVTTNAAIGNWNHSTDRQWQTPILYVYIYDRILTAEEVTRLHGEPYAMFQRPISPGLLYYDSGTPTAWARPPRVFYGPSRGALGGF